jgi:hypothetical protein
VPQNSRLPFSLSGRFTGLAAGDYEVGLCGYTTPGSGAAWNNCEWGRVVAAVSQ